MPGWLSWARRAAQQCNADAHRCLLRVAPQWPRVHVRLHRVFTQASPGARWMPRRRGSRGVRPPLPTALVCIALLVRSVACRRKEQHARRRNSALHGVEVGERSVLGERGGWESRQPKNFHHQLPAARRPAPPGAAAQRSGLGSVRKALRCSSSPVRAPRALFVQSSARATPRPPPVQSPLHSKCNSVPAV